MSSYGYLSDPRKGLSIAVPKNTWTEIYRVKDFPDGVTLLAPQIYGTLPSTKPKGIDVQWVRLKDIGAADDDPTARTPLVVGRRTAWAAVVPPAIEYIQQEDLPYVLRIIHDATDPMIIRTVIMKWYNPSEYIAARIGTML